MVKLVFGAFSAFRVVLNYYVWTCGYAGWVMSTREFFWRLAESTTSFAQLVPRFDAAFPMGPDYTEFMQKYEEYFKIVREESVRGMIITRLLEALEQPSEPTTIGRLVKDRRLTELLLQPVDCQSFERACQCKPPQLTPLSI